MVIKHAISYVDHDLYILHYLGNIHLYDAVYFLLLVVFE